MSRSSLVHLPFDAPLSQYQAQAEEILAGHRAAHPGTLERIHQRHPRFLDDTVKWLPKQHLTPADIAQAHFDLDDARMTLARSYDFAGWTALADHVAAVTTPDSRTARFERAVDAVVNGALDTLGGLLAADPGLVHARSQRITHFDPPVHGSTLLHYTAANGVEGYRQKTPPNAVEIARTLLEHGAVADSLADLYGGKCTTMSLLVSSCHPAQAGLQVALVDTLVDFGAAVEPRGTGNWTSPVKTALTFGYLDAAQALLRRGSPVSDLSIAAGLGLAADAERLLPQSDAAIRHSALALAAQLGHHEIVAMLLGAGEDPNRFNPPGHHAHSTPLHQAALAGRGKVVELLIARGARLDTRDTIYHSTPLGWAQHAGNKETEQLLRNAGATA